MTRKKNRIFGLIGKDISYSFSPHYFKEKFQKENILDSEYKLFDLKEIKDFENLLKNQENLKGINVTIPYKKSIIPFLDEIDIIAKKIQAVNTIRFENNKLVGYNTDVIGFEKSILPLLEKYHKNALIFGTGGAANSVAFVLEKLKIPFQFVSRKTAHLSYSDIDKKVLKEHQILINTTPLGTFPEVKQAVDIEYRFISSKHLVYDLIYNPLETEFLKKAKEQGAKIKNGAEMLEIQAEESWKIWTE